MLLPVGRTGGRVLNGIAAVEHDPITNVNADVGHTGGIIRPDEKDEITGLCVRLRNRRTDVVKPLCAQPSGVHKSAVRENIADEAGAVKGRVGIGAAPK